MDIATQYAKALFKSDKPNLSALKRSLAASGREKLLPRIYAEYQKLVLKKDRAKKHTTITPENERARVLLELYRKLVASR